MIRIVRFVAVLVSLLTLAVCLSAQTESTLYTFTGYSDGGNPLSSLVMDSAGNLYGTSFVGGANGAGDVYELTPTAGGWTQSVLYSFTGGADGGYPYASEVIFDSSGNLYGTTGSGGAYGLGTVFELSPVGGSWTETVLYSFAGVTDGSGPYAGLLFDSKGNIYGTTYGGGVDGYGTVFELSRSGTGWSEKILHSFLSKDGANPTGGLVFDRKGNLYGVTQAGGRKGVGVVFEITHPTAKTWSEKVVYSFTGGADGGYPYTERLIFDNAGNLYGTTQGGGTKQMGVVFRLSPTASGLWSEKVLYTFNGIESANPYAGLILDSKGNLYGTAANGNSVTTVGAVFELRPQKNGNWTMSTLHSFSGNDGEFPESALFRDASGNLYGTTLQGGADNMGVVYEVIP